MSKICSSRNLSNLEQLNYDLLKGMSNLRMCLDYFKKYPEDDSAFLLLEDSVDYMEQYVSSVVIFENCLRKEKDMEINI